MTTPPRLRAEIRRAAESGDAIMRRGGAVAFEIDLQRRADKQIRIVSGELAEHPVRTHGAVAADEEYVGTRGHIIAHADFRAGAMNALDKTGFDRRDQSRARIDRHVLANLALEAEIGGVSRQNQLNRSRIEPDTVVEPRDPVFLVDAADHHHRHQDLNFRDDSRIARENRLDVIRLRRLDHITDPVARHVDARHAVDDTVDLRNQDAGLERRGLDNSRRILGVDARIEIAVSVGCVSCDEAHVRREIAEITTVKFKVGMDRTDLDAPFFHKAGNPHALRTRITKVQFFSEAILEDIEMRWQRDVGLHDMQAVDFLRRTARKLTSQEIGMLLIVAFYANTVAGFDHGLHESNRILTWHDLAAGNNIATRNPGAIALLELGPVAGGRS